MLIGRHSFIRQSKLFDVAGRIDYISNSKRQEYLYATYQTEGATPEFWKNLARENQLDFKATDGVLRGLGIMRPFLIANMVNLAIRLAVALIFAPRFGIAFVWLAVPAGWFANFLISYVALKKSCI